MTLQTQGSISLKDIAGEYQGGEPFKLSQYSEYAGKTSGTKIALSEFYGLSAKTLVLPDKTFDVYTTKSTVIPVANVLEGSVDEYSDGNDPIVIIAVQNPVNGSVSLENNTITFTSSGSAGIAASFEYIAENTAGIQKVKQITMNVLAIPPVICYPDTYSLQQGETLLIKASELLENDEDQSGSGLSLTSVDTAVGGSVSINSDTISFTSSGLAGEPAGFTYHVINGVGVSQSGVVYINITTLPEIESYLYRETSLAESKIAEYTPPTMQDVFNNWGRFDGNNYYADKAAAEADGNTNATAWKFQTDPDRVLMPLNVYPSNGFISGEKVENYTFEATLRSDNADDDTIGLVAAFVREESTNHILAIVLNTGGNEPSTTGCGVCFDFYGVGSEYKLLQEYNIGTGNGWSDRQVRVKIQRQEDIFKFYVTSWDDVGNYQAASEMTINLNDDTDLQRFKGKQPYGYITCSQPDSTYLDIEFKGALDTTRIFDAELNQCWEYVNSQWQKTGTIQSELGYIRKVFNPETRERFLIKKSQIVFLGTEVVLSDFLAEKIRDQRQYVLAETITGADGAAAGVALIALYAPGEEENNYLKDLPTVTTISAHTNSPDTARYNNLSDKNWFATQGINLSGTDFTGGTVVFADGTAGSVTDIGDDNGESAFVAYQVVDYRLFDLTV